jgi:hypothetical protein
MTVETTVKLTKEEEEILEKANDIITKIYIETCDCDGEINYENDIDYLLDEMQTKIGNII